MNILIASSGVLNPSATAALCDRLLGLDGRVTVMTVIEVPRTFLGSMDEAERRSFLDETAWESETAEMKALGYLEERGRRVVEPLASALRALGRNPVTRFVEGTDPVEVILTTATETGAELVVMGATRRLFTEQAWMSVSARVMERATCPLLLIPAGRGEDPAEPARTER